MYYDRAFELFQNKNYKEIFIYGLGICVSSAVNISLKIIDGISNLKINKIESQTINTYDYLIDEENPIVLKNSFLYFSNKNRSVKQ